MKTAFWAILCSAIVPYVIYQGIVKSILFENRAKLRASLGNDEKKVLEMLEKVKIR